MAAYRIRFMKRLNARRERAAEPCVWSVNIRIARDAIRAVSAAKRRFERLSGVANWRLKADYVNVEARPPSGNEAQDVGQWPAYLESRMDIMQKNVALGDRASNSIQESHDGRRKGDEVAEPKSIAYFPDLSGNLGCHHPTCHFSGFIGIYDYSNPRVK